MVWKYLNGYEIIIELVGSFLSNSLKVYIGFIVYLKKKCFS